jgi:hypothetical protein
MKLNQIAAVLIILGVILFILGGEIIGKWIYNIKLMLILAFLGAALVLAGIAVLAFSLMKKHIRT